MNLRNTGILFALFLTMLWVFGLMLATRQPLAEEGFLFPSLKAEPNVDVESIAFERNLEKGKDSFSFLKAKDNWQLVVGAESTTVDNARLNPLIDRIKNVKHNPDANLSDDLASLGLEPPLRSITMKGREEKAGLSGGDKTWTLQLGKESADKMVVYALSSERPGKVFAVTKRDVEQLLFDDPVSLHSQLFFNFPIEEGAIRRISIKSPKDTLELTQEEGRQWKFDKPAFGYAEYDPPPAIKELKGKAAESGVKGLIYAIRSLRVGEDSDFMPLGKEPLASYGLEEGKESMRIHVVSQPDKTKKDMTHEVLLIGNVIPGKWDRVYARLAGDPAVAKLEFKHLVPIQKLLSDPGRLRSRDLMFFQSERVIRVEIEQGKDLIALTHPKDELWQVGVPGASTNPADEKAMAKLAEVLLGKQAIESFENDPENGKKLDAERGFDAPQLVVRVTESVGDEKAAKKDATTILVFGKSAGDIVHVKRTFPDGQVSRFEVMANTVSKITGDHLVLTYLDRALPRLDAQNVTAIAIARGGSPVELVRDAASKEDRWLLKDAREASGFVAADLKLTQKLLDQLTRLRTQDWVKKAGVKEDLSVFGLESPAATVTLSIKDLFGAGGVGCIVGLAATVLPEAGLATLAGGFALAEAGPASKIALRLGKSNGKEGEQGGIYASRSDSNLIFLLPPALLKEIENTDFRDRKSMFALQPILDWGVLSQATAGSVHLLGLASPVVNGKLHAFDSKKVKEVKFQLRTPFELRQFSFGRNEKGAWKDQAGLVEFQLDEASVDHFLNQLAELHALRLVSLTGPQADQKLSPKDATLRVELSLEGGASLNFAAGAAFDKIGYYGQTSAQPNAVFLLPSTPVESWFRGLAMFARDRVAGK